MPKKIIADQETTFLSRISSNTLRASSILPIFPYIPINSRIKFHSLNKPKKQDATHSNQLD